MIVADTSPLCYLVLIGCVDVLPQMFGRVEIPELVRYELSDADAPPEVSGWITQPLEWLSIRVVEQQPDDALLRLHLGEIEAILLAEQLGADLIILDEKPARRVAAERGLRVTGTLGILKEAAVRGLIDLPVAVERLRQTTFRVTPRLLQNLLKEDS
jgi:predicted nucleic acid-binding protein